MKCDLLKGAIRAKAMTQGDVARGIGVSLSRFNAKLNETDGAEFSVGEVRSIKDFLNLSVEQVDEIFFS